MSKILFVDDDLNLCSTMLEVFSNTQHDLTFAHSAEEVAAELKQSTYELIILDWSLTSSASGLDILKQIRASGDSGPIMFLTGRTDIADIEEALLSGADDYLCKPFNLQEFLARIRALLRRTPTRVSKILDYKHLTICSEKYMAKVFGVELKLFPREFSVLELLMQRQGELLATEVIIDAVWKQHDERALETLRQVIEQLCQKLKDKNSIAMIRQVNGIGYRLE